MRYRAHGRIDAEAEEKVRENMYHLTDKESSTWKNEFTGRRKDLADWFVREMAHRIQRDYSGRDMKEVYDSGIMDAKQAGNHKAVGLAAKHEGWMTCHWSTERLVLDVILSILDNKEVHESAIQAVRGNDDKAGGGDEC